MCHPAWSQPARPIRSMCATTAGSSRSQGRPKMRSAGPSPCPPRTPHRPHMPFLTVPATMTFRSSLFLLPRMTLRKVVGHLVHGAETHAGMTDHVMIEPFQHHQDVRTPRDVRMDGDWEHGIIVLAINPIELVAPHLLDGVWADEAVAVGRFLDEHHRRQIVEMPARRNLDEVGLMSAHQRLHPFLRLLCVIDLGPAVADPHIVRLEVVMHQAVIVLDAFLDQQLVADRTEFPPGRNVARRPFSLQLGDEIDAFVENGLLLLRRHGNRILVRISVNPDLVTGLSDGFHLLREGLDRVAGNEPGGFDPEAFEQLQQARTPDLAGEQSTRDIVRRILAPIRSEPASDRIDIDAEPAQNFLCHDAFLRFPDGSVLQTRADTSVAPLCLRSYDKGAREPNGKCGRCRKGRTIVSQHHFSRSAATGIAEDRGASRGLQNPGTRLRSRLLFCGEVRLVVATKAYALRPTQPYAIRRCRARPLT